MDGVAAAYIESLMLNKSDDTVRSYRNMLTAFEKFLVSYGESLATFSIEDMQEFCKSKEESWSPNTKNLLIAAVKGLARFAGNRIPMGSTLKEMQATFAAQQRWKLVMEMENFRVPHHINDKSLTIEELSELLQAAHQRCSPMMWKRIWLLFYLGLRKGEAQTILPKNIDDETGRLVLTTEKTMAERVLYVEPKVTLLLLSALKHTQETKKKVHALVAKLLKNGLDPAEASGQGLLLMQKELPYGPLDFGSHPDTLNRTISGAQESTHITRSVSPHSARHTFITHMRQQLKDDVLVKRLAGHTAGGDMTAVYTAFSEEETKKAMVDHHYMASLVKMAAQWLATDRAKAVKLQEMLEDE